MSRNFAIAMQVKDEHWEAFLALIRERRTTIRTAREWLMQHGYHISEGAVWNFVQSCRRGMLPPEWFGDAGRRENLRQIHRDLACLNGRDLLAVARVAAALAEFAHVAGKRSRESKTQGETTAGARRFERR